MSEKRSLQPNDVRSPWLLILKFLILMYLRCVAVDSAAALKTLTLADFGSTPGVVDNVFRLMLYFFCHIYVFPRL